MQSTSAKSRLDKNDLKMSASSEGKKKSGVQFSSNLPNGRGVVPNRVRHLNDFAAHAQQWHMPSQRAFHPRDTPMPFPFYGTVLPPPYLAGRLPPDPHAMSIALSSMFHTHPQRNIRPIGGSFAPFRRLPPPLDADSTAMLANIQHRGRAAGGEQDHLHTGKISLAELMGEDKNANTTSEKMTTKSVEQQASINQRQGRPISNNNRKPFYHPYMSPDTVKRGLDNNTLIQGSLRVNARNYEEAYVDNPQGDDHQDIIVYGLLDRNRALNQDEVVIRIKDRSEWIVHENLYRSWRDGNLNVSFDENGQPLTIPPIKSVDNKVETETVRDLPVKSRNITNNAEEKNLKHTKPTGQGSKMTGDFLYDREVMLEIYDQCVSAESGTACSLPENITEKLQSLSLHKMDPMSDKENSVKKRHQFRRLNHIFLKDLPDEDWGTPDACLQKTAEKNHRAAVGQLKPMADGNRNWALFSPGDSRVPRMIIPAEQVPDGFFNRPKDFAQFIFVARLVEWPATWQFARGKLYKSLGRTGEVEPETEGLLMANNVDTREFSQSVLDCLPKLDQQEVWHIPEKEFEYRRDFRDQLVFTIDPPTARDLDDALHIKQLDANTWEVGVHIADVSYFVKLGTELDKWASNRATSVYLVHKVIPMLPRLLCEQLCSLNPDVDRLTFSVVWKMNNRAEVLDQWFGRSIIRSRSKMAYQHAQDILDDCLDSSKMPPLFDFTIKSLCDSVRQLHVLAVNLRERRLANGALRLDQPKLTFVLDTDTGLPSACSIYERTEANNLVEEYMLMANMAVARRIESAFPTTALLRRHPAPNRKLLREVLELCEKMGYPVDCSFSGSIAHSMSTMMSSTSKVPMVRAILTHLLMRPMKLAVYFCTGTIGDPHEYRHYALAVPYYTHFTSPIRRYADVMVHRFLGASLDLPDCADPLSTAEVETRAKQCNERKYAAKQVSDASAELFFAVFVNNVVVFHRDIQQSGSVEEKAVVMNVLDQAFDVLFLRFGLVKRIYTNRLHLCKDTLYKEGPPPTLTLFWQTDEIVPKDTEMPVNSFVTQKIQICSIVDCILTPLKNEPTKYLAVIKACSETRAEKL